MHLSCTFLEIWCLKGNGVTDLDLLGSRDVIGRVTIRLAAGNLLWLVNCDHASVYLPPLWRYGASKIMGSRDVIGPVTIRLAVGDFLWVIHCDHASILHHYADMASQKLDGCKQAHLGYFVLCLMLCIALDRQRKSG